MMKHWFLLIFASMLLFAQSCSDDTSPEANIPAAESAVTSESEETATEIAGASTDVEDAVAESSATESSAAEGAAEKTSDRSLRDRFLVTEAPPIDDLPWSSAITLEERIASLEKSMTKSEEPYFVDMHDFGGWEFDEGQGQPFPAHVLALDGKKFTIRGFMMPDIDFENIRKFHLVRSLFSCCFGAPPQLNEILRVSLAGQESMDYTYNTVEVTGTLQVVFEMEDGLVEDLFRLKNATYRIVDHDDPEAPTDFNPETDFGDLLPTGPTEF